MARLGWRNALVRWERLVEYALHWFLGLRRRSEAPLADEIAFFLVLEEESDDSEHDA